MDFAKTCLLKLWNTNDSIDRGMRSRSSTNSLVQTKASRTPAQLKAENRWPWYRILFHAYLIQFIFRFLFAAYVLKTGNYTEIMDWIPIMAISIQMKLIDFNAALFCAPLTLMLLQFDHTINLRRYNNIIRLTYDVMVINPMYFLKLNPQFKPRLSRRKPINSLKSLWTVLNKFLKPSPSERIRWAAPRLRYFPNLDEKIRLRLILLNWTYQLLGFFFLIGTILVLVAGLLYYTFFFLIHNVNSFPKYLIGQVELILICLIAFYTIRVLFFLSSRFLAVEYSYHNQEVTLLRGNANLGQALRKGRLSESRHIDWITFILNEYLTGWKYAHSADVYLVSPLLFTGTISMFCLNAWMVTSLYFTPLSTGDKVMLYCLLGLQLLFYILVCQPMITLANDVSKVGKPLGVAQLQLNRNTSARYLVTKLKIMNFFEHAHSVDPFHFSFGAFGKVTNQSMMEFLLFYSGNLMFMFTTISEKIRDEKSI